MDIISFFFFTNSSTYYTETKNIIQVGYDKKSQFY